jgi:tRNA splicing endonuclease
MQHANIAPFAAHSILNRGPPQADADAALEEVSLDELEATLDMARTPVGQAQRTVFNDLWQRGHYVTSGALYGAHLVAYADDPLACHSFAGVRALIHTIVHVFARRLYDKALIAL